MSVKYYNDFIHLAGKAPTLSKTWKVFKIVSKLVLRLNLSFSFSRIKTVLYLTAAAIFSDSVGSRLLILLANLRSFQKISLTGH